MDSVTNTVTVYALLYDTYGNLFQQNPILLI